MLSLEAVILAPKKQKSLFSYFILVHVPKTNRVFK